MNNSFLILIGKIISSISKILNLGNGSTWPGHIALGLNKNFIKDVLKKNPQLKIVLIAGTNGKTTTSKLIRTILEKQNIRVLHNDAGANLLNGIASSLLLHSSILCEISFDFAVFEVDENSLPLVLNQLTPQYLLLLNLFRDQLDRYGEVNTIASKWHSAVQNLPETTTLILNADDPQIAFLGLSLRAKHGNLLQEEIASSQVPRSDSKQVLYFGLNDKKLSQKKADHAVDSSYCPNCGNKLKYELRFFSHLGDWNCPKCKNKRPELVLSTVPNYPLPGVYNRYNTLAAVLLCRNLNIKPKAIDSALQNFEPAFGRQEKLTIKGKHVQIFLSKNPTSFNQSLRTVSELGGRNILIVLNDRIPDGRDVSWIWDVDFEEIADLRRSISVSGDRVYDIALRLKYAGLELDKSQIHAELSEGVHKALENTPKSETLYILPTYSAMLEVRKILTGKKIL